MIAVIWEVHRVDLMMHSSLVEKECAMTRFKSLILVSLLLGAAPAAQAQQTSDIERVHAANQ
jgi:hypothetical protein